MTDTPEVQINVTSAPDYPLLFDHCANIVESAPNRRLMAAALLNAIVAILLTLMGSEALADILRRTADALPLEEAKARGRMT